VCLSFELHLLEIFALKFTSVACGRYPHNLRFGFVCTLIVVHRNITFGSIHSRRVNLIKG